MICWLIVQREYYKCSICAGHHRCWCWCCIAYLRCAGADSSRRCSLRLCTQADRNGEPQAVWVPGSYAQQHGCSFALLWKGTWGMHSVGTNSTATLLLTVSSIGVGWCMLCVFCRLTIVATIKFSVWLWRAETHSSDLNPLGSLV